MNDDDYDKYADFDRAIDRADIARKDSHEQLMREVEILANLAAELRKQAESMTRIEAKTGMMAAAEWLSNSAEVILKKRYDGLVEVGKAKARGML